MTEPLTPAQERMAKARAARSQGKPQPPNAGHPGDFNGADPAKFDHDGKDGPGGSLPHAESVATAPTPAQAGLAAEREERREAVAETKAELAAQLTPELVALVRAQIAEEEAAKRGSDFGPSARARAAA